MSYDHKDSREYLDIGELEKMKSTTQEKDKEETENLNNTIT